MKLSDMNQAALLELDPAGGSIRFAGQRALLLDAVAMGLLRQSLIEDLGLTAARSVLTRFGFAHGWRMAEALWAGFEWDSEDDWALAGTRVCVLEGLFRLPPGDAGRRATEGLELQVSYEAEQHLMRFGPADACVCWTMCGLMSGYASRAAGHEIFVLEDRCLARGDEACHLIGRRHEEWGAEHEPELTFFRAGHLTDCLDASLRRLTEALREVEARLGVRVRSPSAPPPAREAPLDLVAKSPSMRRVVELARRVAKVDSTVLITGESGTGKERIAGLVHAESPRAHGPFVAINCGAITDTLLESELFGHARGAFTGATRDRPGLFEAAEGGTLLLDEVGEVSPGMQVKLLRALQEREIRRVGENRSRPVDVRVIAATNRDLAHGVEGGGFRQDLYYRLKVVELHVPALRERREDLAALAQVLLGRVAARMKVDVANISPAALEQILAYDWPGNVRELENALERAAALATGPTVEVEDLPDDVRPVSGAPAAPIARVRPLEEIEKEYILAALEHNGGNQTQTAVQLEIGSATLYRKLKSYGLTHARAPSGTRSTFPPAGGSPSEGA
jgi:DNA-binding NtrC family response regulator